MTQTGIDKLWLNSKSFVVHNADLLTTTSPRVIQGREKEYQENYYIYQDQNGQDIYGRSYLNTDTFSIDINKHGMKLNFNPSALLHEYELFGIDALPTVQSKLEEELFNYGIELNFDSAVISRLDLTKQAETRQPCSNYEGLFKYLRMPYYKDKQNFETGFTYGHSSSSKQVVFYDKREELLFKKKIEIKKTLTRCEARWKKKAGKNVGIKSFGVLKNSDQSLIEHIYTKEITRLLKHPSGTQLTIDFPKEIEHLNALKQQYPKGYISKWLFGRGAISVMDQFGNRGNLFQFLKESGMQEKLAIRTSRQIEETAIKESYRREGNYISINDHLEELKNCFL
jgi:hypothetical protein